MKSFIGLQGELRKVMGSWGSLKVMSSLERELKKSREKETKNSLVVTKGDIHFKNVSFKYEDELVLNEIGIEIKKNSLFAIVGESGSGKSTLVNMITGLLTPTSGTILIGECGYNELDISALRSKIGYITQEPVNFQATILDNITMWEKEPNMEKVIDACRKANIYDFIMGIPDKFSTMLDEAGANLSGGQRQRISIARELYKETNIIIFDEATSALDSVAENEIQKSVDSLRGEKTMIVISHRLSTIKNADNILVIAQGRVAQIGNYEELKKDGPFNEMFKLQ